MKHFIEYINRGHPLSRIDARVKLPVVLVTLIMILSCRSFLFPLLVALTCLSLCVWMRVPFRLLLLRFSEPLFIAGVILFLKVFFSGVDTIFSLNLIGFEIAAHRDGLRDGLMIVSRIIGAVSLIAATGFSTPFTELMAGLSWYRIPRIFTEIALFAYRYIFMLLEDALVIYHAQKNRLGYSNIRRGLSSFGILAGSLALRAFDHSQTITSSMVQRGYDGSIPAFQHQPFKRTEVLVSMLLLATLGFLWKI